MCAVWSLKLDDSSWSGKNPSIFDRPSPQVKNSPKISSNSCEFMVHLTPIVVPWSLKHGHLSEASSKKPKTLWWLFHIYFIVYQMVDPMSVFLKNSPHDSPMSDLSPMSVFLKNSPHDKIPWPLRKTHMKQLKKSAKNGPSSITSPLSMKTYIASELYVNNRSQHPVIIEIPCNPVESTPANYSVALVTSWSLASNIYIYMHI